MKIFVCRGPNREFYGAFNTIENAKASWVESYSSAAKVGKYIEFSTRDSARLITVKCGGEPQGDIIPDEVHTGPIHL